MNSDPNAWAGDWEARIRRYVKQHGCETLTEFLRRFPGMPYVKLAEELGERDVAAVQVRKLHKDEAQATQKMREAACEVLVRAINKHVKRGWGRGPYAASNRAFAFADLNGWIPAEDVADRIWTALLRLDPPGDWRPTDVDDPYIVEAFREGWPPE